MAYITKEVSKEIRTALNKEFKALGYKFSVSIRDHAVLSVVILNAPINFNENSEREYKELTHRPWAVECDGNKEKTAVIDRINAIVNELGNYFDKSDYMSDYHHTAFYYSLSAGTWEKPFIYNAPEVVMAEVSEVVEEISEVVELTEAQIEFLDSDNLAVTYKVVKAMPANKEVKEVLEVVESVELDELAEQEIKAITEQANRAINEAKKKAAQRVAAKAIQELERIEEARRVEAARLAKIEAEKEKEAKEKEAKKAPMSVAHKADRRTANMRLSKSGDMQERLHTALVYDMMKNGISRHGSE